MKPAGAWAAALPIMLSVLKSAPEQSRLLSRSPVVDGGTELILLVDDEATLRKLARAVLERQGYRLIEAGSGLEALELWRIHAPHIDALVTDMVMPAGLNGRELAAKLRALKPGLKILFMSGYSPELLRDNWSPGEGDFLSKPYDPQTLLAAVRRTLDGAGNGLGIPAD